MKKLITVAAFAAAIVSSVSADDLGQKDFGETVEQLAKAMSPILYGTLGTLAESSTKSLSQAEANADPTKLLTVAPGLKVKVLNSDPMLAPNIDQMLLWPNGEHPTHIIACNEQGNGQIGVQRINITTGAVANIISAGLTNCDPARLTPWGTVVVGEENNTNGRVFEILDPLTTTNVTVPNSGFAPSSDPAHVIGRPALGQFSFEGIGILPSGIVYLTDENRPGNGGIGNPGGAIVKFIPQVLRVAGSPAITNLSQSPWTAGRLFGMRLGRNSNNTDVGQGNESGRGVWVEITGTQPINLRAAASALKLTSYYRPEDLSIDLKQLAAGKVRFCGTATGQDIPDTMANGDNHWGEVYCVTDGTVAAGETINTVLQGADTINTSTVPELQPLVIGNLALAMPDNIDIQPGSGNFLLNEDGEGAMYSPPRNNDIWACLDDGDDTDELSDNCARLMSLNDTTAEPTGGFFDATGTRYFVSIQHNITGHGVILEVDGWKFLHDH